VTRYRCTRCKYVYDPGRGDPEAGIAQGTPFSALPEGWTCPVSGAAKAEFVLESADGDKAEKSDKAKANAKGVKGEERADATSAAEVAAAPPQQVPARPQLDRNAWTVGSLKQKSG
jgi:rubredoxin